MAPEITFAAVAVFAAVFAGTGFLAWALLGRVSPARRRLQEVTSESAQMGAAGIAAGPKLVDEVDEKLARATRLLSKSPKELSRTRRRLAKAGYYGVRPVVVYSVAEMLSPVVLGLSTLWFFGRGTGLILGAIAAVLGYLLPGVILDLKVRKRRKLIQNGLPDGVDLLIVCVEAGLGLDQAVAKVGEELQITHPALSDEFRAITTEIRAGKPRLEAFRNFAERTQLEDAKALVAMLVQTDRFGTSVAQALRVLADEMRTKRRQRAEERAQKLGVKLVFPLVFFLFPAMYVVVLGPAVIRFVRFFGSR